MSSSTLGIGYRSTITISEPCKVPIHKILKLYYHKGYTRCSTDISESNKLSTIFNDILSFLFFLFFHVS